MTNQQSNCGIVSSAAAAAGLYPAKSNKETRKSLVLIHKLGKKADGIRQHVKLSPKISETLKGKLRLGAKLLKVGGMNKVFRDLFPSVSCLEENRLLKASQCYLSTSSGPIAGLLFISTQHIAFCSDTSLKVSCPANGHSLRLHYKLLIPLANIEACNQSHNTKDPSHKYMQIVTVDSYEFWFMGLFNYNKTSTYLHQAILMQT